MLFRSGETWVATLSALASLSASSSAESEFPPRSDAGGAIDEASSSAFGVRSTASAYSTRLDAAIAAFEIDLQAALGESGNFEAATQAFAAFAGAAQTLASLSPTASALDVASAIVEASIAISGASLASDVLEVFTTEPASALTAEAQADALHEVQASTLGQIVAGIFSSMEAGAHGQAGGQWGASATGSAVLEGQFADLERAFIEGASGAESPGGQAQAYSYLSHSIAAVVAANAQAAAQISWLAHAIAYESFLTQDVEEAAIQQLIIGAMAVSRAVEGAMAVSQQMTGKTFLH